MAMPPLDLMGIGRLQTTSAAFGDAIYATCASPVSAHFAHAPPAPYDALGYAPAPLLRQPAFAMAPEAEPGRRFSQQLVLPPFLLSPLAASAVMPQAWYKVPEPTPSPPPLSDRILTLMEKKKFAHAG